jgi:hypothetical protein
VGSVKLYFAVSAHASKSSFFRVLSRFYVSGFHLLLPRLHAGILVQLIQMRKNHGASGRAVVTSYFGVGIVV